MYDVEKCAAIDSLTAEYEDTQAFVSSYLRDDALCMRAIAAELPCSHCPYEKLICNACDECNHDDCGKMIKTTLDEAGYKEYKGYENGNRLVVVKIRDDTVGTTLYKIHLTDEIQRLLNSMEAFGIIQWEIDIEERTIIDCTKDD